MTFHCCKFTTGLILLVYLVFSGARPSQGDGCFFPPHNYAGEDLREPAQRALVVYNGNQESLFLFVDYQGDAKNFAWVVPCPSKPVMKLSSPEIWKEVTQYHAHLKEIAWKRSQQRRRGGVGSGSAPPKQEHDDVTVHSIEKIGPYEVAILSANTGQGLYQWLEENKYQIPPHAQPILKQYVAEQWFFVAMKVQTPSEKLQSLPPIRLDFDTSSPRYPLRISAINSGVTDIRLYLVRSLREETVKSADNYFSQAFPMTADFGRLCPTLLKESPDLEWQKMELNRMHEVLVPQVMKRLDDHLYGSFQADASTFYSRYGGLDKTLLAMTQGIAEALISPHENERQWAERNLSYYNDLIPKDYYKVAGEPTKEHAEALREISRTHSPLLRDRLTESILAGRISALKGAALLLAYSSVPNDPKVAKVINFFENKNMIDELHQLGSPESRRALNRIAQTKLNGGAAFRFIYSLQDNPVSSDEKRIASRELLQLLSKNITKSDATKRAKALLRQYTGQDFEDDWAQWDRWLEQNEKHFAK